MLDRGQRLDRQQGLKRTIVGERLQFAHQLSWFRGTTGDVSKLVGPTQRPEEVARRGEGVEFVQVRPIWRDPVACDGP